MSRTIAVGIVIAENGAPHFSTRQIRTAVTECGISEDDAAQIVGTLLRRSHAAECNPLAPVRRFDAAGDEVA